MEPLLREVQGKIILALYSDDIEAADQLFFKYEDLIQQNNIQFALLKARYLRQQRNFQGAQQIVNPLMKEIKQSHDQLYKFRLIVEHESILAAMDRYQDIVGLKFFRNTRLNYLSQLKNLLDNMQENELDLLQNEIGLYYNLQGLFIYYDRDMQDSVQWFSKSMHIFAAQGDKFSFVSSLINCAYSQLFLGNWNKAENLFEHADKISTFFTDKQYKFWIVNGYAQLYLFRAEIQKSLKYFKLGTDIAKQLDSPRILADLLQTQGVILWEKSELREALEIFKEVLSFPQDVVNKTTLAISLFYTLWINLELDEKQTAGHIMYIIESTSLRSNDLLYQIGLKLSKALQLKYSSDLADKLKAKVEFQAIKNLNIENNRLNLIILSLLSEILVMEYRATESPEILNQIKSLIYELEDNGKKEGIITQIVDAYLILSKIANIEEDLITAEDYLIKGLELTEEKRLHHITKIFSKEFDHLYEALYNNEGYRIKSKMNDIEDFQHSIINIGKHVNITKKIIVKRENPTLVLILDRAAKVYHQQFYSPEAAELVTSIIEKIKLLLKTKSNQLRTIERTNFQDYHILVKTYDEKLYCYIFTGDSYYALKKLRILVDRFSKFYELERDNNQESDVSINSKFEKSNIINEIITNQIDM